MGALIEGLGPDELVLVASTSMRAERGRRTAPHGVFKWWGRRFSVLSRAVLASLVLGEEEAGLLEEVLGGRTPSMVRDRARGLLVVDPFGGAGTIPLEAGYLGFSSVGIDISSAAVRVAEATGTLVGPGCEKAVECLGGALSDAWQRCGFLWRAERGVVVHAFLARCIGGCRVPALLTVRGRGEGRMCVVISRDGTMDITGGECNGLSPTEPLVDAPMPALPEAARGVRVYAVELAGPDGRRFASFADPDWALIAGRLEATYREAVRLAGGTCTPLPTRGETARLRRHGIECWEQIFTPRQLASLRCFVEAAERRGCGCLARVAAASASRSASMLAIYYQPAGKVNPGLVIKGYWLPKYPVELNPLAWRRSRSGPPLPLGRGGLASLVRKAWRACMSRPLPSGARVRFVWGDARDMSVYPDRVDHVVTDPPYPGMQDYSGLSAIYDYWLGTRHSAPGRDHTGTILGMLRAVRPRLSRGGYMILIIGAGLNHLDRLAAIVSGAARLYGLRRIYWLPGESPGGLGRSRVRGVFIVVARSGSPHRADALEPLSWTRRIAVEVNSELGRQVVDPDLEQARAEELADLLRKMLSPSEEPLHYSGPRGAGLD